MEAGDLPLLVWLSPSFPVGAFAYSHGLEWAAETGAVHDEPSLQAWLTDLLEHGSARNDAILLACAHRAVNEAAALNEVAELAVALANSAERRLETVTQGDAFILAARQSWPCTALDCLTSAWEGPVAYPVALGVTAAGHGVPLVSVLPAFALAFVANLVSAAVRLSLIGQSEAQRVTAALIPACRSLAAFAEHATLEDIGGCAFHSDIAAIRHETQYSRLFRS